MKKFNCPSCGAEITFQSAVTVSCVCRSCRSLVVRHDVDVEAIGQMAELPQDMSPFQLGTTGVCDNIHFSLIGRLRIAWQDGSWNEWFMLTDKGEKGWMAEAQGSLAVSFEREQHGLPTVAPRLHQLIVLDSRQFSVTDIKHTECVGSEGELPFPARSGRRTTAVDLMDSQGGFAGIEYADQDVPRFFIGKYVEFDALKFSNLRALPGWDARDLKRKAGA